MSNGAVASTPRYQDQLYHELLLPPEAQAVRAEVRAFADARVAPRAHAIAHEPESVESFPRDVFSHMGAQGLFRIPFDTSLGGRGLAFPSCATAVTIEELAYHSSSIAAVYDVHCILAGHALRRGSAFIHGKYLAPLIAGTAIGSFATTEPDASTDLSQRALQTRAERTADGYRVTGHKRWISNAPVADFAVVLCNSDEGMVTLVIELNQKGVRVGKPDLKLGNQGQLTADVYLDGVEVPDCNRIDEPGRGLHVALSTLTFGRIGIAASGVGMAQAVFDEAVTHLKRRKAFGRSLAQFQHWQFKMADYATRIEVARTLYTKAAIRLDSGIAFPEPEAAMAKSYCTELAVDIARDGIQVFGGYGFMRELSHDSSTYKVEQIYRDAKISEIYEGTNEIQRMIIARSIFGREMIDDPKI
ncbi:acyl-CoA dehydrogenase family protein [Sphingomonas sp. SRS2]|uniref:acyl-CoA dehydrogenase family protein n=1 Tax=Sphingomonas sp. SRS2 TaxID=133190 RepID=UPI000618473E|nr:acyl-CoA dehydrogenase family protein [Sphingomonas sp. SRS2]KKC25213.1 acyl-CoA dehydrogenase [Sphingomonas sp. SRS2]